MAKPKVFVSQPIPKKGIVLLEAHFDAEANAEKRVLTKKELIARVKGKDALLCILTDKIDADVLSAEPKLKIVSNFGVGFNNIDVPEATKRGIVVANTPNVLNEATADCTIALMLDIARRISEGDRVARAGNFTGWEPEYMLGVDVYGKTLGIVGLGRIGKAVAERASKGFGMRVFYSDVIRQEDAERELGIEYKPLETLLMVSDFVSLHVPLNEKTKHMVGGHELAIMKKTACLINMARGPVVDEKALINALKQGTIFGAALDVYENEPEIPKELRALQNVVLAPHLGSATVEARDAMSVLAAQNLVDFFAGRTPRAVVNKEAVEKVARPMR
ncbi:MAG: D-glycerate dehydrogenase [Candidatus Diapherotrites archaeon]